MADTRNQELTQVNAWPAYSLWLLPQADAQELLAQLIARLSRRFGTRAFAPHVTVQGNLARRLREVSAVGESLAHGLPEQRWRVRGIEQSSHYYRAFYAAFDESEAFGSLVPRSEQAFATADGLSPFAHLSLAYGTLDAASKDVLAGEIAAELPQMLTFDRLAVALSGSSVAIASWRILQTFRLSTRGPDSAPARST